MNISKKTWLVILIIIVIFVVFELINNGPFFYGAGPKMKARIKNNADLLNENSTKEVKNPVEELTLRETLCKNINNTRECDKKVEEYNINKYPNLIKRQDNKLILKIDNGTEKIYEDVDEDTEGRPGVDVSEYFRKYSLENYFEKINSYLVIVGLYEGANYLLVNRVTGDQIHLPGIKIAFSPNGDRFVSYECESIPGYSIDALEIVKIDNNYYKSEFELYPDYWGPVNVNWVNNTTIEVDKGIYNIDLGQDTPQMIGKIIYELIDNKWIER